MTDRTTDVARTPEPQASPPRTYVDPFSPFHEEMDRLMNNVFGAQRMPLWPRAMAGIDKMSMMPSMDVEDTDQAYTISVELPGMAEDDVEVSVDDGLLVIAGEKRMGESRDEDNVYVSERRFGRVQRALRLPDGIDEEGIEAHVDKGVLTVVVPKTDEIPTPSRQIPVTKA